MVAMCTADPHRWAGLRIVKLDEWAGLPMRHPSTCEHYVQANLIRPLGVPAENYLSFTSDAPDRVAECRRVQRVLDTEWGGIDVAILGLGHNGHLGLNEPAPHCTGPAHVAQLAAGTVAHPMLKSKSVTDVSVGMTLGMDALSSARAVLLMVTGTHKAGVLSRTLSCTKGPQLPASLLRLPREGVTPERVCVCDAAAYGQRATAASC